MIQKDFAGFMQRWWRRSPLRHRRIDYGGIAHEPPSSTGNPENPQRRVVDALIWDKWKKSRNFLCIDRYGAQ
jgi:hypothetical protein